MYDSSMVTTGHIAPRGQVPGSNEPALLLIDVQPKRTEMRVNCPHWLLALTIPFSRSDRGTRHRGGVDAGCPEGLFRTDCSAGKSPSVAGGPFEGPFRREGNCSRVRASPSTLWRLTNGPEAVSCRR
jgi:hypothetical protein